MSHATVTDVDIPRRAFHPLVKVRSGAAENSDDYIVRSQPSSATVEDPSVVDPGPTFTLLPTPSYAVGAPRFAHDQSPVLFDVRPQGDPIIDAGRSLPIAQLRQLALAGAVAVFIAASNTTIEALPIERLLVLEDASPIDAKSALGNVQRIIANAEAPQSSSTDLKIAVAKALGDADILEESIVTANAACADALTLLQRNDLKGDPDVVLSDDGMLSLEWHKGDRGVMLLFAGEGEVAIAFRRPGLGYAENGLHALVDEELPARFFSVLASIIL